MRRVSSWQQSFDFPGRPQQITDAEFIGNFRLEISNKVMIRAEGLGIDRLLCLMLRGNDSCACSCKNVDQRKSPLGRPGRDLSRQKSFQPARCQRIIVSGRTTTRASRQSKSRESNASEIRVTGSTRRDLTPRSTYNASCRRRNKFSAIIECVGRKASRNQQSVWPISWIRIPTSVSIG